MTEEELNKGGDADNSEKEGSTENAAQPPAAPPLPFVAPPYRERVHSRKLQAQAQPQQPAETQPVPEAPIAPDTSTAQGPVNAPLPNPPPDMLSYFNRTPARLPVYVPRENPGVEPAPEPSPAPTEALTPAAQPALQPALPSETEPVGQPSEPAQAAESSDSALSQFWVDDNAPAVDPREAAYIAQQEKALSGPVELEKPAAPPCRHEYVRIFQRKLKDLNRRMVCTKAYLPTGFKMGDFQHLGENSFCFCAKCRARLYPKRSQAEKAEARLQLAQSKALKLEQQSMLGADLLEEVGASALKKLLMHVDGDDDEEIEETEDENTPKVDIHVEEMEQESVEVEDLDVEGLKANQEESDGEMYDAEEG